MLELRAPRDRVSIEHLLGYSTLRDRAPLLQQTNMPWTRTSAARCSLPVPGASTAHSLPPGARRACRLWPPPSVPLLPAALPE
uniref:Uncharacterized protein n=1 Tax=Zea mays TaxID=4577 RepID=C4IZ08_MAIZE|nr:unknown [Zea mays]